MLEIKHIIWYPVCCDMDQSDTISKIELIPLSVLSTDNTNSNNNIHMFLQQFAWPRVNRDSNLYLKVLGMSKQWNDTSHISSLKWHFLMSL